MSADTELLATCWTSAGDAAPQRDNEVSPESMFDRLRAIASTGWNGVGLVHADIVAAKSTIGLEGLNQAIDDVGLKFREVEILADWWTEGERRIASDQARDDLFEAAAAIGASNLKVLACLDATPPEWEVFVRELRELGVRASDLGINLALEPMPFSSNIRTVRDGMRLVEAVDLDNVGLTLDTWHVYRAGTPFEQLERLLAPESIFIVEIDDCAEEPVGSLWDDTVDNRLLPGEGSADTSGFVEQMLRLGFGGPWGVEIISTEHRNLPIREALARAADAAVACIQNARKALRR